jgi:hypothetical protein
MFSILALLTLLLSHDAPRDPRPFAPGLYAIEQRDPSKANRYAGTTLEFTDTGDLIWVREGEVFAMMRWSVTGDLMRIEDAELCALAPVGLYKVAWMEKGFIFDKVADDCYERANSATTLILVPVGT